MKKQILLICLISSVFTFMGCKPDLVIKELTVNCDPGDTHCESRNIKATAVIKNQGSKNAGSFLVYFNADENPESQSHRPQVSQNVPGLMKGESKTLVAEFKELKHPDNNNLRNVFQITVIADPKNSVAESNENNNSLTKPLP